MADGIIVQYVGFTVGAKLREYTFVAREVGKDFCEYTVAIANEAFESHRAKYQDGPSICSVRLRKEFEHSENHPPTTHFLITDAELAAYQDSGRAKAVRKSGSDTSF